MMFVYLHVLLVRRLARAEPHLVTVGSVPVRAAHPHRLAGGDLPVHVRDDQPEPGSARSDIRADIDFETNVLSGGMAGGAGRQARHRGPLRSRTSWVASGQAERPYLCVNTPHQRNAVAGELSHPSGCRVRAALVSRAAADLPRAGGIRSLDRGRGPHLFGKSTLLAAASQTRMGGSVVLRALQPARSARRLGHGAPALRAAANPPGPGARLLGPPAPALTGTEQHRIRAPDPCGVPEPGSLAAVT